MAVVQMRNRFRKNMFILVLYNYVNALIPNAIKNYLLSKKIPQFSTLIGLNLLGSKEDPDHGFKCG